MKFPNNVHDVRIGKGISREELAQFVGITRQSIGLIEAGRVCPSTIVALRISHVLDCSVEDLFWDADRTVSAKFISEDTDHDHGPTRVHVSSIGGKMIARPVSIDNLSSINMPAQGISQHPTTNGCIINLRLLQSQAAILKTVFISGCDVGLGLLANYALRTSMHYQGTWFNVSNQRAIAELEHGITHIAAIHYSANEAKNITQQLSTSYRQFHFATSELGWILPKRNPKGFQTADDLSTGHFRLINREVGSGTRARLDEELGRVSCDPTVIPGYASIVNNHFSIADAVAKGFADVGIGHAAAAEVYGLTFKSIEQETCALIIPEEYIQMDVTQVLLETLNNDTFRSELASFGPYDVVHTGDEIQSEVIFP